MMKNFQLLQAAAGACVVIGSWPIDAHAQNAPARVKAETDQVDVQPDGTAIETHHRELQVFTAATAAQLAQLRVSYVESMQDVEIIEAYTLKPDGRKLPVEPSAILTQQAPATTQAAIFTDQKQKVVIFPNVEVGDTLVLTEKRRDKQAYFSRQYLRQGAFPPTVPIDDFTLTIAIPKSMGGTVEAHDLDFQKTANGDKDVYTTHYSNLNPAAEDVGSVSLFDRRPRYFVSTFRTYEDLGRAYAALFVPKETVTPKIKAQANAITAGITDRREQARAIYEWVSARVRYVAIEFGQGAIVPHDAESVLTNAYGDCKDHATLFSALLKAKGIDSEPVLINAGNGYTLSTAPTLAQLNHMITWIPELKLYADTTAIGIPFGMLRLSEYGKSVVLAGSSDVGIRQIPVVPADSGTISYTSVAKLDDMMRLTAESTTKATGVFVADLRNLGAQFQAIGLDRAASDMLKKRNMPLATGAFTVAALGTFAPEYSITGKFSTPRPIRFNVMPDGLRTVDRTGDFLMGPLANPKIKDTDPTPCRSGKMIEDLSLEFPADHHLAKLPSDSDIKTANLQFTSHWALNGQTLSVHREFIANIDQAVCTGDVRKSAADALASVLKDYQAQILIQPN
jgi:transglutaminase-like putative cysteine protease